MFKFIDNFLNGITMYRLMLYFLIALLLIALVLSFFNLLPFKPLPLVFTTLLLLIVCWVSNTLFARILKIPTNLESVYISALILALILPPIRSINDLINTGLIAVFAMASKYILNLNKKHIFNPAAFGVTLGSVLLNYSASWWVGNQWMAAFVVLGGILIIKKVQRFSLVLSFILVVLGLSLGIGFFTEDNLVFLTRGIFLATPLFFFATVMLTEPLTTPPTKLRQMSYGGLVGVLYTVPFQIGPLSTTPEVILLIGNIFSYLISPKEKLLLKLKEKIKLSPDIYDFVFKLDKPFKFLSGQYLEWTLSHKNPDSRGVRRYFTIAASPTENNLRIGVKFYPEGSSFKKSLINLTPGEKVLAGQLTGEFTLPKDLNKKLVFIAGGIGVTPFRSMIKYLLDIKEKRQITLFYSAKFMQDFVYKDIFDKASKSLGIKTVYILTDKEKTPKSWKGYKVYLDASVIKKEVPDFKERIFFLSGPHSMVDVFSKTLKEMGVPVKQIKIDFFPGYA